MIDRTDSKVLLNKIQDKLSVQLSGEDKQRIEHYKRIRKVLGWLGILFAGIVVGYSYLYGCRQIQGSISAYYYTSSISLFCGFLFSIGFFLITYKGFYKIENYSTNLAGFAAFIIALCPTTIGDKKDLCNSALASSSCEVGYIHYAAAVTLFVTLAFISFFIFTLPSANSIGDLNPITDEKKFRNRVYRICGVTIILSLILVAFIHKTGYNPFPSCLPYLFTLETICLVAFGFSWLVKGETLFSENSTSYKIARKMKLTWGL